MSLEITAKLISTLPEQTGNGKNGPWVKQDFIVETEEQYPKKICMSAWGDMVGQMKSFNIGQKLKINFRVESREYNGRWYTDVRPWRVNADHTASVPGPIDNTPVVAPAMTDPMTASSNEADDLPF